MYIPLDTLLEDMAKQDDGLYIELERPLKEHVKEYVADKRIKGGVSAFIKDFLIRKTKYQSV